MAYERVNWENLPSTKTPVNATNLNKVDEGIANAVEKSDLLNLIYPVGSIYISVNSTNPANLFGGTWQQIKDRFLLACGNNYKNGTVGGEETHTLTIAEMPKHKHTVDGNWAYDISGSGFGSAIIQNHGYTFSGHNIGDYMKNSGGGQPHNNMPPYLAVYMWKRIT